MKMKLLYLLFGLVALSVCAVEIEWYAANEVEFDTVVIGRVSDTTYNPWDNGIYIGYEDADDFWQATPLVFKDGGDTTQFGSVDIYTSSGYDSAYYFMELKSGDNMIAYSGLIPYSTVELGLHQDLGAIQRWMVTSFTPIPEPTSGLLLLLGGALLGLRRKDRCACRA